MQQGITLTFNTQADLEAFCRLVAGREAAVEVGAKLDQILQRLAKVEAAAAALADQAVRLHSRVSRVEEDGLSDWDGKAAAEAILASGEAF